MSPGRISRTSKFADQLSGTRHFNVSLSIIESHLASAGRSFNRTSGWHAGNGRELRVRRYRACIPADRHVERRADSRHH
jgi:hypothetical protein